MADLKTRLDFAFTVPQLPDGKALTVDELERTILKELEDGSSSEKQALWNLAVLYNKTNRHGQAVECMSKFSAIADDPEEEASCYLAMGQLREQVQDYAAALIYYRAAFGMKPGNTATWYWINNNLGYCLIQLGQFKEAEGHLKAALAIDPKRPNAFKNLGLALLGQMEHGKAAECFVRATQVNASDARSLAHLERMVDAHPQLFSEVPDLQHKLDACRKAVAHAASQQPDFNAHWKRLREQQKKS